MTIVEDWRNVPNKSIIEVHTIDGKIYEFDNSEFENWKISNDSSIVGAIQTKGDTWSSITIPATLINVVYVKDSPLPRVLNTSLTVTGTLETATTVIAVIYFIINFPAFNIGGGR